MKLRSDSFVDGAPIPAEFAFGTPGDDGPFAFGGNRSPHLAWSDVPDGTKSFVVLCVDPDVPSVGDDVNQADRSVPFALPRVDFFHWVLVDVPATVRELAAGTHSEGITPRGKPVGPGPVGRQGSNNYTQWFDGDADMGGDYGGYDGPCPPWNDERLHHYRFTVFALDVERLPVSGSFQGPAVREAMAGHVLGSVSIVGTYTMNKAGAR